MELKFRNEIITDIKKKKELSKLDNSFISGKLDEFLEYDSRSKEKLGVLAKMESSKNYMQFSKSKEHSFLIKSIRAELRKIYGVFIKNTKEHSSIMKELASAVKKKNAESLIDIHKKILSLHRSTFERMDDYDFVYKKIFLSASQAFDGKEKFSILDLACGLNPMSSIFYRGRLEKYYANDISSEDCAFINEYFKIVGINGRAFAADITTKAGLKAVKDHPVDICFLFKALDSLEREKKGITSDILRTISAKILVVSFPLISISGSNRIVERKREWFEKLMDEMKLKFEKFSTANELFYICFTA